MKRHMAVHKTLPEEPNQVTSVFIIIFRCHFCINVSCWLEKVIWEEAVEGKALIRMVVQNQEVGWLVGFNGISTYVGYLTPNPFLWK